MELLISGYLNYCSPEDLMNKNFSALGVASVLFGYLCLFLSLVVVPGFFLYLTTRDLETIRDEKFTNMYGVLYLDVKTSDKYRISYFLVFILRRFWFIILAFLIQRFPTQQV